MSKSLITSCHINPFFKTINLSVLINKTRNIELNTQILVDLAICWYKLKLAGLYILVGTSN